MLIRCRGCKQFYWPSLIIEARCDTCDFRTYVCEECGGKSGAIRRLHSHVAWYNGTGIKKYGYPDYHKPNSLSLRRYGRNAPDGRMRIVRLSA